MAEDDKQSRTEKPTPRRRREARQQGQVARTPELVTWLTVLVGTYVVQYTFKASYTLLESLWYKVANGMSDPSTTTDISVAKSGAEGALSALAPALLATMGLALVANLAQTRGLVTFAPLKPSFSRLNPKNGLARIVSPRSLWEVAKQAVRMGLLALIAWKTVSGLLPLVAGNGPLSSFAIASLIAGRALTLAREVAAIGLVLAAADYAVQYRKIARSLRMTKEEVKEERKATDANPLVRGQIRRRQRQLARNRMIAAVARAEAVVVNPTHFAVALEYHRGQPAPKVIAKGTDFMALRIREAAGANGVTVVEDPPLARALYDACELEHEIPVELYEAVARLLTFIYSLRAEGRARRIDGQPQKPPAPLLRPGTPLPLLRPQAG